MQLVRALVLFVALFAPATTSAGPRPPEPQLPIHRGVELVAVRDVELHEARIMKGSRVTVVDVRYHHGKPATVSLELKDGHVLRAIAYERVLQSFRPAKG